MDLSAPNTFIEAVPGCHLPFHWPRLDKEQELCVRLPDIDGCMWSGAVPIHETQSLYINIRYANKCFIFSFEFQINFDGIVNEMPSKSKLRNFIFAFYYLEI